MTCFLRYMGISILAPREGGDAVMPSGGSVIVISILAPREGGDCIRPSRLQTDRHFNPRPPRGRRPFPSVPSTHRSAFQSSPPAREATVDINRPWKGPSISILAPREGGDCQRQCKRWRTHYFNPRPPRGRRRRGRYSRDDGREISILAPREGGDPILLNMRDWF